MIEVTVWTDIATGDRHFKGIVHLRDLLDIKLDPIERMQMSEPSDSAADILQDLSTLAFRQQQQLTTDTVETKGE